MTLDVNHLREETPGCKHVLHFNNAGAALSPNPVITAIKSHIDLEATIGGYEAAQFAADKIKNFYTNASRLINCQPEEIAFSENATRAWGMAFNSIKLQKGDKILTAVCEYASNYLAFLHKAKTSGVTIEVVKNDASGQLDVADLEAKIDPSVKLIAITHVPTNGGLINPAEEIGRIAKQHNIPYLLDSTQSIGQFEIDVKKIGCDFLCATGRKYLRGPRGTGFLYASNSIIEQCAPPFIDLQSAKWIDDNEYEMLLNARRFESWEQYIAGKIALGVAIDYALEVGINNGWKRIDHLAKQLREQLAKIPGVLLHDLGVNKCGIVTFTIQNNPAHDIQKILLSQKTNVSIPIMEYARLDMASRNLTAIVRASVHYYNTEKEIEVFCSQIKKLSQ